MVKAVVGDEAHLKAFEETLASSSSSSSSSPPPQAQVGLVVGKLSASSDRALVYALLPTPLTDAAAPACSLRAAPKSKPSKGGGRGSSSSSSSSDASLDFDVEWIAEHARQVSRMLLGGMSVIGAYLWASEASFKATSPAVLSQVIRAISQACYGSASGERLLIHISYSPRRWTCRICEVASASLRPCDFKYSKLLSSLQTFRCTYNFEIRLTSVQSELFKKVILKAISHLTEEVQNARALVDGHLFSEDMNISTEGAHQVDFLVPFNNAVPVEECSLEGVAGLIRFVGSVSALAYLGPKESVSEAISDLKADIVTSLKSRLDIILDEADDGPATDEVEKSPSQKQSETAEDALDRCKEVIALETAVESSSVLESESAAACSTLESFWVMVPGSHSGGQGGSSKLKDSHSVQKDDSSKRQSGGNFNIIAALIVLLVALLAGLIFTFSAGSST